MSLASEFEFNSNEATAGSITDHDLLSAEGEDDEETLSMDPCGSPVRMIKNNLSPQGSSEVGSLNLDSNQPSTSKCTTDFYGLSLQQTKECFYKDLPSSSKNFNLDDPKQKCVKENTQYLPNIDSLNLQSKDNKAKTRRNDILNNGSRRYSDSSAQKSNLNSQVVVNSRFKTTLVTDDLLRPSTSSDNKSNSNLMTETGVPSITKAKNTNIKPGFTITET